MMTSDKQLPALPTDKYATLLADPPWDVLQVGGNRGANHHYELMTVEGIAALPVKHVVADSAHLWLWVTNATVFAGRRVMETWGFTYRAMLTWVKPYYGMGQ